MESEQPSVSESKKEERFFLGQRLQRFLSRFFDFGGSSSSETKNTAGNEESEKQKKSRRGLRFNRKRNDRNKPDEICVEKLSEPETKIHEEGVPRVSTDVVLETLEDAA